MSKKKNVSEVMGEIKEEQNKRLNEELEKKREEQLKESEAKKEIEEKLDEVFDDEPYEEDEDEIKAKKLKEREKKRDIRRAKWEEREPEVTKILGKVIAAFMILAGIVLLIALNTPSRRFERNMLKGDTLMRENSYAEAVTKYRKALSIEPGNVQTHLSILCAKEAGAAEDLKSTFNEALNYFKTFDDVKLEENRALITEYVLHESTVFADNTNERLDALEKGYELTAGNADVKRILTECVSDSVTRDRNEGNFDQAVSVLQRFKDKADIDSAELITAISKEKTTYELKKSLLTKAYEALKDYEDALIAGTEPDAFAYDFSKIMAIDGSEEANDLVNTKASESYIYIPSENYNMGSGIGAGLYTYSISYETEDGNSVLAYSFYVGEFKEGLRSGKGIMFTRTGENSFVMFAGDFSDDLPNGQGKRYVKSAEGDSYEYTSYSGTWNNNLAEGEIAIEIKTSEYPDVVFSGKASLSLGKGEVIPTESEEYVVQNLRSDNLISVLASSTEGYSLMLALWQRASDVLSATGVKGN